MAHCSSPRLAERDFAVTNASAPAVAGICHRLDGIPLAIELAAARIRMLTAEEIHARLVDRFRLLTGGSRTAAARQRTLAAAIDWSQTCSMRAGAHRRLAVFRGGWTIGGRGRCAAGMGSGVGLRTSWGWSTSH
jgi:predicted ATPase